MRLQGYSNFKKLRWVACISGWVWAQKERYQMGQTQLFTKDRMVLLQIETCSSLSKSREEETWEDENFHKESQGSRGWKGPLEVISSNFPAQVLPSIGFQSHIQAVSEYLHGGRLQPLWATSSSA